MVSPKLTRPRPGSDHIEDSNSTASLFLGGVRRNWMSGSKNPPVARTVESHQQQQSQTVPALVTTTAAAAPPPQADSVRSGPAEGALMSPVTPGSNLSPAPPLQISQVPLAVPLANNSDPRPVALPSPVPSTGSQSSPVVTHTLPASLSEVVSRVSDGTAELVQRLQPAQLANTNDATLPRSPSRPGQEQDGGQDMTATTAERVSAQQSAGPTKPPLDVAGDGDRVSHSATGHDSNQSPLMAPADRSHSSTLIRPPTERGPLQLSESESHAQWTQRISPNEDSWKKWKTDLEHLKRGIQTPPSDIVPARLLLLENAVEYRDHLYLVVHQVYCRQSVDGTLLDQLPHALHETFLKGMDKLNFLLENNNRMPASTLWIFAHFPFKLKNIWHEPLVALHLQGISHFLHCLEIHFKARHRRVESIHYRGYPPLVDELRAEFQIASPVILSVLFASICRQVYDTDKLTALNKLFRKDLFITAQLLEARQSGASHKSQAQHLLQQMNQLISEYTSIPMRSRTGSPIVRPVPSGYPNQTGPMHVNRSRSTGNQPVPSPVVPAFVYNNSASNSPQEPCVQSSGYPQQHPFPYQTTSMQQRLSSPNLHAQMRAFNPSTAFLHASASHGQTPVPLQSGSRAQSLPCGQTAHFAHPGQGQQGPPMQGYPGVPYATSPPAQPHPTAACPAAQVPPPAMALPYNHPLQQRASQMSPLLPPAGYHAPIIVQPNPMRLGLHQADLRDPVKKLVKRDSTGEMTETQLYHFQSDFLLTPQSIDPNASCYNWHFDMTEDDCGRFPRLQDPGQGQRLVRTFQTGCRSFRLRSIKLSESEKDDSPRLWPTKNTIWPSVFYIHVNGVEMFPRRKVQNGKDLPLDITHHLKHGQNRVTVHFILGDDECKDFTYAFGIERMVTTSFEHVRRVVGVSPAEETRQVIRKRLTPSVNDDEFSFITDNLTINLVDPYMAQIYNTPVRSVHCNHLEAFDLDTYIHTRKSESGPTPFNDNWYCPICRTDARPQFLRVDGFLSEVRDELIRSGRLELAQAIKVQADGAWSLKVPSEEAPHSPRVDRRSTSVTGKRKADSVIESELDNMRPKSDGSPVRDAHARTHEPVVIVLD